jgi:hypothetical protein
MASEWLTPSVLIQGAVGLVTLGGVFHQLRQNTKDIAAERTERKSEARDIRDEMVRRDTTQWEHINDHTVKIAKLQGKLGVNGG